MGGLPQPGPYVHGGNGQLGQGGAGHGFDRQFNDMSQQLGRLDVDSNKKKTGGPYSSETPRRISTSGTKASPGGPLDLARYRFELPADKDGLPGRLREQKYEESLKTLNKYPKKLSLVNKDLKGIAYGLQGQVSERKDDMNYHQRNNNLRWKPVFVESGSIRRSGQGSRPFADVIFGLYPETTSSSPPREPSWGESFTSNLPLYTKFNDKDAGRDARDGQAGKFGKDSKDSKDSKDFKNSKDSKDGKGGKDGKSSGDSERKADPFDMKTAFATTGAPMDSRGHPIPEFPMSIPQPQGGQNPQFMQMGGPPQANQLPMGKEVPFMQVGSPPKGKQLPLGIEMVDEDDFIPIPPPGPKKGPSMNAPSHAHNGQPTFQGQMQMPPHYQPNNGKYANPQPIPVHSGQRLPQKGERPRPNVIHPPTQEPQIYYDEENSIVSDDSYFSDNDGTSYTSHESGQHWGQKYQQGPPPPAPEFHSRGSLSKSRRPSIPKQEATYREHRRHYSEDHDPHDHHRSRPSRGYQRDPRGSGEEVEMVVAQSRPRHKPSRSRDRYRSPQRRPTLAITQGRRSGFGHNKHSPQSSSGGSIDYSPDRYDRRRSDHLSYPNELGLTDYSGRHRDYQDRIEQKHEAAARYIREQKTPQVVDHSEYDDVGRGYRDDRNRGMRRQSAGFDRRRESRDYDRYPGQGYHHM